MWHWLTRTKQELDTNHTYLRVEFLTTEEKSKKHQALKKLEKQYKNDQESIVPYEHAFTVSLRFTLNTNDIAGTAEPVKNKMQLKEFICHLEVTKNEELEDFMKTQVKDLQMFLLNEQMISRNDIIPLYSEIEATIYTPSQVLEIIYERKGLWERVKHRGKKIIGNFPKYLLSIITKIFAFVLGLMGFQTSAKSIIFNFLPTKSIIQWLISFIGMFFPMFAPFINMGSKYFLG